jgi:hypothetical protein
MLGAQALDQFFTKHFHRMAFRLEVRDSYDSASENRELARYLAGDPRPDPDRSTPWLNELRADAAAGKAWRWVLVVRSPLSDYLRFSLEWTCPANVRAGGQVRVLDLAERARPGGLVDEDFWLLDGDAVLIMHCGERGQFLWAEPAPAKALNRYLAAWTAAWEAAEPLSRYWAAHPQYHRDRAA